MLVPRFLPLRVCFLAIYFLLVICLLSLTKGCFSSFKFEYFTTGFDVKFVNRMCLISRKILIRNCGCHKPCIMGNPGCCEGLKQPSITMIWLSFLCFAYNTHNRKLLLIPCSQTGLLAKLVIALCKSLFVLRIDVMGSD